METNPFSNKKPIPCRISDLGWINQYHSGPFAGTSGRSSLCLFLQEITVWDRVNSEVRIANFVAYGGELPKNEINKEKQSHWGEEGTDNIV